MPRSVILFTAAVVVIGGLIALGNFGAEAVPASGDDPGPLSAGRTYDETAPPGANYDVAQFRLWVPADVSVVRGVVALMPGSNVDGRDLVTDSIWLQLASRNQLALLGSRFTDRAHTDAFIEEYVDASRGSGQALESALASLARASGHVEIATAPLFLWGLSAGGEFNYEFVNWRPERVAAFVVNKGGIYYSALLSPAARAVPGLLFTGGKDLESRTDLVQALFGLNRRSGALWALAHEPDVGHSEGRSRQLSAIFFEDVLSLRVEGAVLRPLEESSGVIGDLETKRIHRAGPSVPAAPTAWLPTERTARAWRDVVGAGPD